MFPIICRIGPFTVFSYGLTLVLAFLAAVVLAVRRTKRLPSQLAAMPTERIVDFFCLVFLGGIAGGRLFYALLRWEEFVEHPLELIAIWHGGLVWYGAFAGGLLVAWGYARAHGLSLVRLFDQCAPFIALGHAIGRVGCLLNGCCYGHPTTAWYGVRLRGVEALVVPTQLIESAGLVVLALIGMRFQRRLMATPGRLMGGYLVGYGLLRLGVERLRGDQVVVWSGLTLQQLISLALLAGGVIFMTRKRRPLRP